MMTTTVFVPMSRQRFRRFFQPSRIVIGVIPAPNASGVNLITLCFLMHCSYKPPMIAVAIQNINRSFDLIQKAKEYVLAVPGESMAEATLLCGIRSMTEIDDKATAFNLKLESSERIAVPGLANAIGNIELVKEHSLITGDHCLVVGRAVNFRVRKNCSELPLLSIGPDTTGYEVLQQHGIHRIGTVKP